ncbi:hypothetical protein Tco_1440265 [Tanacetum coccineum]
MKVEESLNVTFDETPPPPKTSPLEDDDLVEEEAIEVNKTRPLGNDLEDKKSRSMLKSKAMMMHSYVEAEAPELLVSTAGTAAGLKCAASPFFMLICF